MDIPTRKAGSTLIIEVRGPLAGQRAIAVNKIVEKARQDHCKKVAVDMSRVSLLDSVGLGGLIYCQQILRKASKSFVVCAVPEHIRKQFDELWFARLLAIMGAVPDS
jgi:anti-anti-sigma factor